MDAKENRLLETEKGSWKWNSRFQIAMQAKSVVCTSLATNRNIIPIFTRRNRRCSRHWTGNLDRSPSAPTVQQQQHNCITTKCRESSSHEPAMSIHHHQNGNMLKTKVCLAFFPPPPPPLIESDHVRKLGPIMETARPNAPRSPPPPPPPLSSPPHYRSREFQLLEFGNSRCARFFTRRKRARRNFSISRAFNSRV